MLAYDRDHKQIRLLKPAEQFDLYVEVTWATYYRTVGIVALLVLALAENGLPAFAAVSTAARAVGFLGVFALSMLSQRFER